MGRPRTEKKYEHLTLRFPEGLLDQWRAQAERHDRSLNAEIVRALRLAIDDHDEEDTTARRALATASS